MKKITGLLLALIFHHAIAFCQEKDYTQDPTLSINFFFNDFKTASLIRTTSLGSVISNKQFGKVKDMTPGLAINYICGLNESFDFSTTLAGSFVDYLNQDGTKSGADKLLLEGDVSLRGKMFSNKYFISPFFQVGAGISKYQGYYAAIVPVGIGLQFNLFDEAYLIFNSQYRMPVTDRANYHFFHSIGLAGTIGKRKAKASQ
jgi:OOP family OmpA-OmpF porin